MVGSSGQLSRHRAGTDGPDELGHDEFGDDQTLRLLVYTMPRKG
jgi:hypothetical protein